MTDAVARQPDRAGGARACRADRGRALRHHASTCASSQDGQRWLATSSITFRCRTPGAATFVDIVGEVVSARLNDVELDVSTHAGRTAAAPVARGRERAGRLLGADRDGLGQRDPAQRRPAGQARLRLVDVRAGRRQAGLGLLRPARPQGGARLPGQRACRSGRCSATARPRSCSTATTAAGCGSSRTPRGSRRTSSWSTPARSTSCARSAAATAWASTAGSRCGPTSSGTPRSCSGSPSRGWPSSGSGSRSPSRRSATTRSSFPTSAARWRTGAASPGPTACCWRTPPTYAKRELVAAWCCCTRWRTCGSATW